MFNDKRLILFGKIPRGPITGRVMRHPKATAALGGIFRAGAKAAGRRSAWVLPARAANR